MPKNRNGERRALSAGIDRDLLHATHGLGRMSGANRGGDRPKGDLDEIGGGLTEHECNELVETVRAIHARGVTIVWIEHIVHVLLSAASRLIVMDFGQILAQGEPRAVMADARVREVYMGIPAS